ncbi:MAG: primosomal protein N' family DNA-binding protein, partial [Acidimicrobiales bacterium]
MPAPPDPNRKLVPKAGRVARVVPDVAAVRKTFDYLVPSTISGQVRVGTQVRIVLHNRRVTGWVVADDVVPPDGLALRPLAGVRGWGPPPAVIELARWAAWRWAGPVSALLGTASSPTIVTGLPAPATTVASLPRPPGVNDPLAIEAMAGGTAVVRLAPDCDPFAVVCEAARRARGRPVGPGGPAPGVLVLAPAQEVAAGLAVRLQRAGYAVALMPGQWAAARAGGCVVGGTRAAAFAPVPVLAAAVVIDAHDEAYHEERAPTWCAWEVVAERARREGAPCALVSPCPSLDVLGAGRLVTQSRADERRGWATVEVADRRNDDPRSGLYSARLVDMVRWAGAAGGRRVLCVLNRTGRVRLLACAACRELARCERCGTAVESVVREVAGESPRPGLRCRRCECERPVVCAGCGSTRLKALRVGVSRVREELEALACTPVAEVSGTGGRVPIADAAVVVGTEAVLHRVPRADAVAFLDFDAELLAGRFLAGEQALALVARAARLVAPAAAGTPADGAGGRVLIQTRQPRHDVVLAAVSADPGRLA